MRHEDAKWGAAVSPLQERLPGHIGGLGKNPDIWGGEAGLLV